jgi:hypothetical protein
LTNNNRLRPFFFCKKLILINCRSYRSVQNKEENYKKALLDLDEGRRTRRCAGAPPHHLPSGLGTGGTPVRTGSRRSSDPKILHLVSPEASKQQTTSARNFSWAGTAATRSPATGNSHHNSEELRPRDERTAGDDAPQSITTEEESRRSKSPLRSRRHLPDAAGWNLHNPTLQTEEKRGSLALPPPEQPAEDEGPSESTALRWIGRWIRSHRNSRPRN